MWGVLCGLLCLVMIGYWVSEWFVGKGIMLMVVVFVIDVCFMEYGLYWMEICICLENVVSFCIV